MNDVQYFATLREANAARQDMWDGAAGKLDLAYRANELAGEVGEALSAYETHMLNVLDKSMGLAKAAGRMANVAKKIERERRGLRGSRATLEELADELGDVVVCVDLIARAEGLPDVERLGAAKFNKTSDKVDLPVKVGFRPFATYHYFKPGSGKWYAEGTGATVPIDGMNATHDSLYVLNGGRMPGITGDGKDFDVVVLDPTSFPRMVHAVRHYRGDPDVDPVNGETQE